MKMRRLVTLGVTVSFLIMTGFYFKRKFYTPSYNLKRAEKEAARLAAGDEVKNGDIIFQTSLSGQSRAIQLATHSRYSHCGIIYQKGSDYFVFEAVEPVKLTPLKEWIAKGQNGHFVIKRLKNADQFLTSSVLKKMEQVEDAFKGKHYDLYFEWSDDRIYCSELIWKTYKKATGLELGKLEKLRDFDLTSAPVKQKLRERYGDKIPLDEPVISPAEIYDSELLFTIESK